MRVLVTGSAGFIGTHLCRELWGCGHQVEEYDRAYGEAQDILRWPLLLRERVQRWKPDVVVHLAAQVGRLFGEDDVVHAVTSNAAMTTYVAQVCGELNVRMVYASTSEVYGDRGNEDCPEADLYDGDNWWDPRMPHNIYGLSKRWGEEAVRLYAPKDSTVWRISMPYGPGLPAGRGRAALINFLYNALHGLPITVHRGSERSWCWIGDTVRAMRMTLELEAPGAWNIGRDDNATSMLDVARRACRLARPTVFGGSYDDSLIELVDPPQRQTPVKRLNTSKIRALGWEPRVDLSEGMRRTLAYVRTLDPPRILEAA